MPTIKDIAREAGVSHGTVSNVINGRGNVSVEKIQLVWQAAEKLGYKVNSKAQQAVRSLRPHQVMRPFRMHGRESKSLAWLQRFLTVNDRVNEYTDLGM